MGGKKSRRTKKRQYIHTIQYISNKREAEEIFYDCEDCKKRFRQESTFLLHRLIHKREQTFSCNICKEEFPFLSRLQKHCLLEHSNDLLVVGQESNQTDDKSTKPFRCNICGRGFVVHSALKRHLSCVHEKNYDEESLQSLTSTKISCKRNLVASNNDQNSKNDFSPLRKQTKSGSAEPSIKKESDTSYGTLWDEGPSSSDKNNRAVRKCHDFSKNDSSPDRSAELCIEMESDSFDPKEACITLWSEGSSSFDEESADSTGLYEVVEPIERFCCPICNKEFIKKCYLQGHLNTHMSTPADYTPRFTSHRPVSSKPSGALGVLNIGPYICDVCHKGFVKNEDFQKHCLTHSEQNTYSCKVCSKQFARYGNFRAHCETHMTRDTFKCDICGTNFHYEKHLIDHQQMQSENANLQCEFCNKKFDQACSLITHEQTHRGYHCEDCGSVFSVAGALKRHQRSHANISKCAVCGKAFAASDLLRKHLETHFGSMLYHCDVCNAEFEFQQQLRKHSKTHHNELPHTCQLCNKGFLHAWSLSSHLLEHEANQDANVCSLVKEENGENVESPGKVVIKEISESYEKNIEQLIKKEKDC